MKAMIVLLFLLTCLGCGGGSASTSPAEATAAAPETTAEEIAETTDDPYLISNGTFLGMAPGGALADFSGSLRKGLLQTGEGDFDVYYIDGAAGEELGYLMTDPRDEQTIGTIYLTSPDVVTEQGIRVGVSFGELQQRLGVLEVHGSEIEGYTYARANGLAYRLDSNNWSYEIDPATIKPETEIIEVIIE